jgi:hypothetical protein
LSANFAFKTAFVFMKSLYQQLIYHHLIIFVNLSAQIKRACRERGPVGKREK